ncbi:MAG: DnaJ domain-containing protein [Lachnospiraceae bacterium]|nr:DnaJ domain-containing protein [Lachnospiraceae bacterium]
MDFKTRREALEALLLPPSADEEEVKTAYRELLKKYHPDQNPGVDTREEYDRVVSAYSYLAAHPALPVGKIIGNASPGRSNAVRQQEIQLQRRREYRAKQKERELAREKEEKRKRKEAHDEAERRFWEEAKRKEEEYNDAMEKIAAIRTARAIEAALDVFREREEES